VLVMSGIVSGQQATVVYGHLRISSVSAAMGDSVHAGDMIGLLGKGYSDETDGERKHLHLSIHKGRAVNIRGYMNSKESLADWIDPMLILPP